MLLFNDKRHENLEDFLFHQEKIEIYFRISIRIHHKGNNEEKNDGTIGIDETIHRMGNITMLINKKKITKKSID